MCLVGQAPSPSQTTCPLDALASTASGTGRFSQQANVHGHPAQPIKGPSGLRLQHCSQGDAAPAPLCWTGCGTWRPWKVMTWAAILPVPLPVAAPAQSSATHMSAHADALIRGAPQACIRSLFDQDIWQHGPHICNLPQDICCACKLAHTVYSWTVELSPSLKLMAQEWSGTGRQPV